MNALVYLLVILGVSMSVSVPACSAPAASGSDSKNMGAQSAAPRFSKLYPAIIETRNVFPATSATLAFSFKNSIVWGVDYPVDLGLCLPKGTYALEAEDSEYWYMRATAPLEYRHYKNNRMDDCSNLPGGIMYSKNGSTWPAAYIDGEGDAKLVIKQLPDRIFFSSIDEEPEMRALLNEFKHPLVAEFVECSKLSRQPKVIASCKPVLPQAITSMKNHRVVVVNCLIDHDGIPQDVKCVTSTDRLLDGPVIEAVRKWRFSPGLLNGKAVSTRLIIPVKIDL